MRMKDTSTHVATALRALVVECEKGGLEWIRVADLKAALEKLTPSKR